MAVIVIALTWVPSGAATADNGVLETIWNRGEIWGGVSIFAPWVTRDESGELAGFEIDVATQFAKDRAWGCPSCPRNGAASLPLSRLTGSI